jgi:hypothetical protein
VRDPNTGEITARPRTASDGASDPAVPGNQPPPGPASVENGRLRIGEIELSEAEVAGLLQRHAAEQNRLLATPKPGEYKLEFAHDYVLPQGVEWKWDEANPLLGQVREFATAAGLTQDHFSKLLGLHAASRIREDMAIADAHKAEVAKLGENANARVDSIKTFLNGHLGTKSAKALTETLFTARQVQAFEKLMHHFVSQGSGGFRGSNREPETPGKISQAEYDKLGYAARLEYASRFQQPNR